MKQGLVLILVCAVSILTMGCSPTSPASTPSNEAALAPAATSRPAATRFPSRSDVTVATPTLIAVQIPQTEPSIGKDKTNMSGVPIPTPLDPSSEKLVLLARQDLAKQLAISVDQINLVQVQAVTWPDGSLGCPQPGMMYTQALIDGLLIQLRASGRIFEYHSGGNRPPFLCQSKS